VSISVAGAFWDSQIYSGELILFDADGGLHKVNWGGVVDQLASANPDIQTALRVAFSDSDLFYAPTVRKILRDPQIELVVRSQLSQLARLSVETSRAEWSSFWRTSNTPFDFLPVDTDIYYHHLFAASDYGLFSAPRAALNVSNRKRHHDGRVMQVKASNKNTAVAAAGGGDGLLEFDFLSEDAEVLGDVRRLARISCSACEWALQSVLGWSQGEAFLASFRQVQDPRSKRRVRTFDGILRQQEIFGNDSVSSAERSRMWGSHEKIFRISGQDLDVLDYKPPQPTRGIYNEPPPPKFSRKGKVSLGFSVSDVISMGTAPFGSVLELANKIVVLRSDQKIDVFDGEAVHWRVFPRSENYSNQLHIVYEDRIQIISFMHDYFVEQSTKLTGFVKGGNEALNYEAWKS